ncbi:MAG: protein-export chaperone SecB [Rhizomicrobium sp.]|jgi:preprotein translocase subunit SecB
MSDATNGQNAPFPGGNPPFDLRMQVIGQYVKDLSFENPGAPMNMVERPQIDLGVDLQAKRLDPERYEVELKLRVSAKAGEKTVFLLELAYAGLLQMTGTAPDEVIQQVLLIEAPMMLFPFARRIVADAIRDGGMPPLMIEPIDFTQLYRSKMGQGASSPIQSA